MVQRQLLVFMGRAYFDSIKRPFIIAGGMVSDTHKAAFFWTSFTFHSFSLIPDRFTDVTSHLLLLELPTMYVNSHR